MKGVVRRVSARGICQPIELVLNFLGLTADLLDESPVSLLIAVDGRELLPADHDEPIPFLTEWTEDDEEALDVFKTLADVCSTFGR